MRTFLFLALPVAIAFASPNGLAAHPCSNPFRTDLIAAQFTDVGDVLVCNDAQNLYVRFKTIHQTPPDPLGDWHIRETHLAVATDLSGIPQRNGNPVPGLFPYSSYHDPVVTVQTYSIPLEWPVGTVLYIAAHAGVGGKGDTPLVSAATDRRCETAWAAGFPFPGANWATYFLYTVQ